jgi:hypothetical protein
MTENRFRLPADELYAGARVPAEEQVEVQAEPEQPPGNWSTGPEPWLGGGGGDVDGD